MIKTHSLKFLKRLPLFISCALLSSCAQYQAMYTPPSTTNGMNCVSSCLANQQACNTNCSNSKMLSNIASGVSNVLAANKNKYSSSPYGSSSNTDDCGCAAAYNECYRSCGGKINYVCVANCPK